MVAVAARQSVLDWEGLPSLVLVEIYNYLSSSDRLNASSTCANWRASVFQTPLEDTLKLVASATDGDAIKYKFLSSTFAHKVTHLNIILDGTSLVSMDLVCDTLTNLTHNASLKTLRIRCSEQSLTKGLLQGSSVSAQLLRSYFVKKIIHPLILVLSARNSLDTFSFPLIEELTQYQQLILTTLSNSNRRMHSLCNLFLITTPKPELFKLYSGQSGGRFRCPEMPLTSMTPIQVCKFSRLQILGLDHDVLNDDVLSNIGKGGLSSGLTQMNLTAVKENKNISNHGWSEFSRNNPNCKVRLTVMGANMTVEHASNLVFPATPLTHFRALYCKSIRMNTLNSIIMWNEHRLEHLELVNENQEWTDNFRNGNLLGDDFIDPFIYAAWRVKTLRTIKIGYLYCGYDIIGVAKLAGHLNNLEIPKSQILHWNVERLTTEVSKAMGRPWTPIDDGFGPGKSRSQLLKKRMCSSLEAIVLDENY